MIHISTRRIGAAFFFTSLARRIFHRLAFISPLFTPPPPRSAAKNHRGLFQI
jgi:hypothetical protein